MSPGRPHLSRTEAFHFSIAIALIAFGCAPTPAAALTRQDVDACVGQNATPDSRINGCTAMIQSGTASGNNLAAAYNGRCLAYHNKGEEDRAVADCTEAIRLSPNAVPPLVNRGLAYHGKGDDDHAIADYDDAAHLNPAGAPIYLDRGNSYVSKGNYSRAIADYDEAIRIAPKYAQAYLRRGLATLYFGALPEAVADLDRAAAMDPKSPYAALWLDIANRRSKLPSRLAANQVDMNTWPAPVVRLYLGQSTPAAVRTSADDDKTGNGKNRVCEANFYIGELASLSGARDDALRLFRLVVADCWKSLIVWFAANAELNAVAGHH